jgi:hypothetical protein
MYVVITRCIAESKPVRIVMMDADLKIVAAIPDVTKAVITIWHHFSQ